MAQSADVGEIVRTLLVNGYLLETSDHPASDTYLFRMRKRDLLGAEAHLLLLFAKTLGKGLQDRFTKEAKQFAATPIFVSPGAQLPVPGIIQYATDEFFDLLGGAVLTDRIFAPNLTSVMDQLGHNQIPLGFSGKADDLLEAYSKDCIQFLLECPVSRYGQERRFEPLPDGLALGRNRFNVYFDAKAYGSEFHPTADDIRRFTDYVRTFNQQYSKYVGPISVFAVISGSFSSDKAAVQAKAKGFLAESSTPLCLIRASDLAESVAIVRPVARARGAINWKRLLITEIYDRARLQAELDRIKNDGILK